jgi:hypothetical protein
MASLVADRASIRVVRDTAHIVSTRSHSDVLAVIGVKTSNQDFATIRPTIFRRKDPSTGASKSTFPDCSGGFRSFKPLSFYFSGRKLSKKKVFHKT